MLPIFLILRDGFTTSSPLSLMIPQVSLPSFFTQIGRRPSENICLKSSYLSALNSNAVEPLVVSTENLTLAFLPFFRSLRYLLLTARNLPSPQLFITQYSGFITQSPLWSITPNRESTVIKTAYPFSNVLTPSTSLPSILSRTFFVLPSVSMIETGFPFSATRATPFRNPET